MEKRVFLIKIKINDRRAKALLFDFYLFFEAPAYHIYAKIVKPLHNFFFHRPFITFIAVKKKICSIFLYNLLRYEVLGSTKKQQYESVKRNLFLEVRELN